jgi:hypothetical protein
MRYACCNYKNLGLKQQPKPKPKKDAADEKDYSPSEMKI